MLPPSLYAIGGLGLVAVLAGGWGYIEHQGKVNAELQVAIEKKANEVNTQTIKNLNDWKDASNAVQMELAHMLEAERNREDDERSKIDELAKTDEAVRKWRDTPLPDALKRVLNKQHSQ